jgi:hypothetical protein
MILDKDPAEKVIADFYSITYSGGSITAMIHVCDADPIKVTFTRKS